MRSLRGIRTGWTIRFCWSGVTNSIIPKGNQEKEVVFGWHPKLRTGNNNPYRGILCFNRRWYMGGLFHHNQWENGSGDSLCHIWYPDCRWLLFYCQTKPKKHLVRSADMQCIWHYFSNCWATFWVTSFWMLIGVGWVLSLVASFLGMWMGRRAAANGWQLRIST